MAEGNAAGRNERIEKQVADLYDIASRHAATIEFLLENQKRLDERMAEKYERTQDQIDHLSIRMNEFTERVDSLVSAIGAYIRAREGK